MHFAKILFLFLFTLSAAVPAYSNSLVCEEDQYAKKSLANVGCEIVDIAAQINNNETAVPAAIYHFGKEEYLMQDVAERNIPQKAWDEFIMGNKTRFPLAPNRRGLYGTVGIADKNFGGGTYNWMIEVRIKDECRKPKNVVTINGMPESDRFKKWFEKVPIKERKFESIEAFAMGCYNNGAPKTSFEGNWEESNDGGNCRNTVDRYFNESEAKVIQDTAINRSFYIRDRNCILDIRGSPEELIEIAASQDYLWLKPCDTSKWGTGLNNLSKVLERALMKTQRPVEKEVIDKLIANGLVAGINTSYLKAYNRCRDQNDLNAYLIVVESNNNNTTFFDDICPSPE